MQNAEKLQELAAWYREYAERAGDPAIWEARLRTAEDLEREAHLLDSRAGTLEMARAVGFEPELPFHTPRAA